MEGRKLTNLGGCRGLAVAPEKRHDRNLGADLHEGRLKPVLVLALLILLGFHLKKDVHH